MPCRCWSVSHTPLYLGGSTPKGVPLPPCVGTLYLPAKGSQEVPTPGVEEEAANVEWEGGWVRCDASFPAVALMTGGPHTSFLSTIHDHVGLIHTWIFWSALIGLHFQ